MKASLILAAALALTTSAAFAQTVAPGTTPGAQTGNPSNMPSAGSTADQTTNNGRMDNMSSTDRNDKKMMRKGKKMKTTDNGTKVKTKM
ncbi:MAG: hypothetical protein EOO63_11935 [Hymenobacter sp.]|nr:MAG: hypothetical protein EOO63_11935 [Hymenobacter sp.]